MISKDIASAALKPTVLSILSNGESYGYEIIRLAYQASGEKIELGEGAIYPLLHRLERLGYIESFWRVADTGRKRKYYRIRQAGKKELASDRIQWQEASEMLRKLWEGEYVRA